MKKKSIQTKKPSALAYTTLQITIITFLFIGIGLVIDPGSRDPFLGPRMLYLALAIGIFWLFSYRTFPTLRISQSASKGMFLFIFAFLIWVGFSGLYAINPNESIFYLVKFAFYFSILLFWIFLLYFSFEKTFHLISKISTVILLILSVIGIAQATNIAFTNIPGLPHPVGLSGNRNIFGAFIALQLPFCAYLFFHEKKSWQWLSGLGLLAGILTLILSQTRSAWVGAGIGFLLANFLFYIRRKDLSSTIRSKLRFINLGAGVIISGGLIFVFFIASDTPMVKELKNRFLSLVKPSSEKANIATGNIEERLYVWSQTLEMSKDHPILGVGAANWRIAFPEYGGGSSKLSDTSFIDKIRVRPHNFFLRTLGELGWVGLLIWLGLLTFIAWIGFQALQKSKNSEQILIAVLSLTALTMFFFDLLFSFSIERIETMNLILFFLACLIVANEKNSLKSKKGILNLPRQVSLYVMLPLILIGGFYGFKRWQYDRNLLTTVKYDAKEQPYKMLASINRIKDPIITLGPVNDPIQMQESRAFIKLKDYPKAIEALEQGERYHPNNHRIHTTKGYIYIQMRELEKANKSLQKALALSPNYTPMLENLCSYYFLTRQYQKSMEIINQLEWEKQPHLKQMRDNIQHKIDFGAIEDSEIYQAINFVKNQVDEGKTQLDITPLIKVYNKMDSDSLFIGTYIETIYGGIAYAYKQKNIEDRLETVSANKDRMKAILLRAPNLVSISQRITQNHHFQTATAMQFSSLNSINSVNQVLFQIE